jgi:hypothetical protein
VTAQHEVSLADLVTAARVLEPTDTDSRQAIAALLGFTLTAEMARRPRPRRAGAAESSPRPMDKPPKSPREREARDADRPRPAARPQAPTTRAQRRIPHPRPSVLRQLPDGAGAPPQWVMQTTALDAPAPGGQQVPPPPLPLLLPRWTAGILQIMLATAAESDELDVVRAAEMLARQEILLDVPRRREATLRYGVQLLVDAGSAMLPFAFDQEDVARAVRRVVGEHAVELLHFAGTPLRDAGPGPRSSWERYEAPRQPRPILVLSDLGVARPALDEESALPHEWLRFAAEAVAARCPVVALVPYPPRRVPAALRRVMHVVPWDRTTTVADVRRILGGVMKAG